MDPGSPEIKLLSKFVGRWNTDGVILENKDTPSIKVFGTDTYEWLSGEIILLHRADVYIGTEKSETIEIIGYDTGKNLYTMQYHDNKGNSGSMVATYKNDIWTFLGGGLRFTGGFKNGDKEFSGIWEKAVDGKNWAPYMDIKLTKTA